MTRPSILARTFGHLTGAGRKTEASAIALAVAEQTRRKAGKAETAEEKAAREAEEKKAADAAAAAAAAEGDDCECPEGEDGDDCDCDDSEMSSDDEEAQAANAARSRERARCAAIFASPYAKGREGAVANIAFGTSLSRKEGRALLASMGPVVEAKPSGLHAGMSTVTPPRPNNGGAATAPSDAKAAAVGWDRALKK